MTASRGCTCARAARQWGASGVCGGCGQRVLEEQLTPVLIALLCGGTGLVLWRNPRGFDKRTNNKYGLAPGAADFIGLYGPGGFFVAVEMKTKRGSQSDDQLEFEALVERRGGVYAIVRTEADAHTLLQQLASKAP